MDTQTKPVYGFSIYRSQYTPNGEWEVQLPHQCGSWIISGEYGEGVGSRVEAIDYLTYFIEQAQTTLLALEALPDDWKGELFPAGEALG